MAAASLLDEYPKMVYISFNIGNKKAQEYGNARITNFLLDSWMEKKLLLPGITYTSTPPALSAEELAALGPEAAIAMGKLEGLTFNSCVRNKDKIDIKSDAIREWTSVSDDHHDAFLKKKTTHDKAKKISICEEDSIPTCGEEIRQETSRRDHDALVQLLSGSNQSELPAPEPLAICDGTPDAVEQMDTYDKLKEAKKGKSMRVGPTDFAGVQQVFIDDSEVWFLSTEDNL